MEREVSLAEKHWAEILHITLKIPVPLRDSIP